MALLPGEKGEMKKSTGPGSGPPGIAGNAIDVLFSLSGDLPVIARGSGPGNITAPPLNVEITGNNT